jgi:hypothetical protein
VCRTASVFISPHVEKQRPVRLTYKQAPHRPGTAPAHGLRADVVVILMIPQADFLGKEVLP